MSVVLGAIAIVGFLGGLATGFMFWRAHCTAEVRSAVVGIRKVLEDADAMGGLDSSHFLAADAQQAERDLNDVAPRLNDKKLRGLCGQLAEACRMAFSAAPPASGPLVAWSDQPLPPELVAEEQRRSKRMALEVGHANDGLRIINHILRRLIVLERYLPHRS